ncbi:MAG TPA: hypothetical protein VFA18_12035, partial [Gemmataceae bacterium]|nr:hypothetical protein [Gemmataceae bacterium]
MLRHGIPSIGSGRASDGAIVALEVKVPITTQLAGAARGCRVLLTSTSGRGEPETAMRVALDLRSIREKRLPMTLGVFTDPIYL